MAPRLTAEQRQYAQMEAENMRRYEVAFEENSAQLRKNPTELATLYQEYAANAPAEGFMPAHDDLPKYVDEAEAAISKPKQKFLDYLVAANAAAFLLRLVYQRASEYGGPIVGDKVLGETMRLHRELSLKSPFPLGDGVAAPAHPDPALPQVLPNQPALTGEPRGPRYPDVIPGCVPFSSAIADYPRTPVSLAELTNWKGNPDPLLGSYFIASGDNAEDDEIFQVISFSTIFGGKKVFYLQFADEDEAFGFQADHFFKLLEKAARIMSP